MIKTLEDLAAKIVRMALDKGATDAESTIVEGDEFSASIRMREVENLKEAGSRGAGLRLLIGKKTGSAYTSDLSENGLQIMVSSAIELASITTEDPHAGLPEPGELGSINNNLQLFSSDVAALETPYKIQQAKLAEDAALDFDPRISNSEGSNFESNLLRRAFANSRGFQGSYETSSCSLSVVPVAHEGDSMERDYWYTLSRSAAGLEKPADVGSIAAQRALRRLHAKKVATQKVPVVFEPRAARTLLGHLFEAINGDAIYRKPLSWTANLEKILPRRILL